MPSNRHRVDSVAIAWARIEKWILNHLPDESLPKGASMTEILRVEKKLGVQFPEELRQLYQLHDGSNGIAICRHGYLMPLLPRKRTYKKKSLIVGTVIESWSTMRELLDEGIWSGMKSAPRGPIKRDWWNVNWIPIVDNQQGDNLCVDMDPAKMGKIGQIIDWWHERGASKLLRDSATAWLSAVATDLEEGEFKPEP